MTGARDRDVKASGKHEEKRLARCVAFSCKRRGFCPSCLGRRMSDTAVWLTEHVIPRVQIRQWVNTLPWELRVRLGYNRDLCAMVLDTFVRELQWSYRWQAKCEFGLSSVDDAFTGMRRRSGHVMKWRLARRRGRLWMVSEWAKGR